MSIVYYNFIKLKKMTRIERAEKALDSLLKKISDEDLRIILEEVDRLSSHKTIKPPEEYIHIPLLFPYFL